MDGIYSFAKTDKTRTEKGFLIGQNGKSSKVISGDKAAELSPQNWSEASVDLKNQGDKTPSNDHLHPLKYDDKSNVNNYGVSKASQTDVDNVQGNTQPSMVMGFTEEIQPLPSGQIGGTPSVEYVPEVGFYDGNTTAGESIISVKYSDFKDGVKKMNRDK